MRPAGRGDLESLYFDYPKYSWRRPPEADGKTPLHDVTIVGAGPVGLVAAIELGRRGVACVLLEAKDTLNDGSRALCISRHSLETLQQLGVSDTFIDKGLGWTHGRSYYQQEMIYRLEMPHSEEERFLPMYNLQQQYIEKFLADRCMSLDPLVDLRWQSEVTGIDPGEDEVTIQVSTPEGEYPLRSRYVLAADGGKSAVRNLMGLRLAGENFPGDYVIADIRMAHDFPTERRCFFEPSANPGATLLVHRQPDDIWRIDYQLQPGEDREAALREENIRARVDAILEMIGHEDGWDLEWWSIYTANTLCLEDYRHGRVIFIGDAAHIVPIFGVRGLNNGISDAVNAAWKLAYQVKGRAGPDILGSYTPERRGATLDVFLNAGKSSRFMTPPTRGYQLMRKAVLELSLSEEFTRPFANPRQVTPYTYRDTPLSSDDDPSFDGGPAPGEPVINRRLGEDEFLLDHLGLGFCCLWFTDGPGDGDLRTRVVEELSAVDPGFSLVFISRDGQQDHGGEVLVDLRGAVFEGYSAGNGTVYLVRPDRHVCARWKNISGLDDPVAQLKQAMETALGFDES